MVELGRGQGDPIFNPRIYITLNMESERSRIGTYRIAANCV
jgi:hypothetical protein